jgi:hypothetical protein
MPGFSYRNLTDELEPKYIEALKFFFVRFVRFRLVSVQFRRASLPATYEAWWEAHGPRAFATRADHKRFKAELLAYITGEYRREAQGGPREADPLGISENPG